MQFVSLFLTNGPYLGWQKHGRALIEKRVLFVFLMQYTLKARALGFANPGPYVPRIRQ